MKIVTGRESEVLRQKAKKIKAPLAPDTQDLLLKMVDLMRKADGIGLAAPQVSVSLRLCVTEIDGVVQYFMNPVISSASREKILFEEGCLSLPGEFFPIERSQSITLRYTDERGKERKQKMHGLLAICLQHELDHLDGVLIADRYKKQKIKQSYAL